MACHLCELVIDGPRVDLLCSHSFHTLCFFGINEDNHSCTCGQNVLPAEIREEMRIRERAKEEDEQEIVATELKAAPGFKKDLRELRSCLRSANKAQKSVFSLCREERTTFIAVSRPFVEQILELQKTSLNNILAKQEYKTFRIAQYKAARKLRFIEQTYPRFNRRYRLLRIFRLPSPWGLRMSIEFSQRRLKRFFKTLPKLF
jgi:bifunctional DNA-binding transcriptional regulator/antitoxin component of YhaV-PrlF toxin-antitoxin module